MVSSSEIEYTQFNDQSDAGARQVQVESQTGPVQRRVFAAVTTAEPSLTSVSPTLVAASDSDQTITLFGSNFAAGDSLPFTFPDGTTGSNLNPITVVSSSEIEYTQFNDQSDAGAWQVQVESPDGTLSNAELFAVVTTAEPSLTSVSPTLLRRATASPLTLSGSNFAAGDSLLFTFPDGTTGSNLNPITVVSSSEIEYTQFNDQSDAGAGKSRSRARTGPCPTPSCSWW